jgi:hypothetical protein
MIARVRNYSTTLTSPTLGEHESEAYYVPLSEKLCSDRQAVDDICQQIRLARQGGVSPLVVIFEPVRPHGR